MARGMGSVYKTHKCNCDNPKWEIINKRKIRSGKQLDKTVYMICCNNCRNQWETTGVYAKKLEKE